MQPSYRGLRGMQVHAVPDSEKAFDASGRKLPWGYEMASTIDSREPVEKGPFGRSQRRSRTGLSRSRSKTAEPRREEDRARAEQLVAEEAVFGNLKKVSKDDSRREALGEVDGNVAAQASGQVAGEGEATEVSLYGFGEDLQWAAIDFYERVSGGSILEDYLRQPAERRFDISRSLSRATSQANLTKGALRKKNKYAGGDHWIKVTFDSRGAAELACARSPHVIKGHLVYAEPYLGRGPGKDEAILASNAGAQITDPALPTTFSTDSLTASPNGSSSTATSATATGRADEVGPSRSANARGKLRSPTPTPVQSASIRGSLDRGVSGPPDHALSKRDARQQLAQRRRTIKIDGTTAAVVLPASAAMLPKQPKQSWSAWAGAGDVIGSTVPKKDDGGFDWELASFYWKLFYLIDLLFGTDLCGLKMD